MIYIRHESLVTLCRKIGGFIRKPALELLEINFRTGRSEDPLYKIPNTYRAYLPLLQWLPYGVRQISFHMIWGADENYCGYVMDAIETELSPIENHFPKAIFFDVLPSVSQCGRRIAQGQTHWS